MTSEAITGLLRKWGDGDRASLDQVFALILPELRLLARRHSRPGQIHTLQPTALVNELYLRFAKASPRIQNREHLLALASQTMRQLLIDHARVRNRIKRGAGATRVQLNDVEILTDSQIDQLVAIDCLLSVLEQDSQRAGRVFQMRFFGGFSVQEVAEALEISENTVIRDWSFACRWLRNRM